MAKEKRPWVFTAGRKASIKKARKKHEYFVDLGKRAYKKGMR